jgi:hypothetical protein
MFEIGDTLVSLEVIKEEFICNLDVCKGACCVEGDSGAPLLEQEVSIVEQDLEKILPYVDEKGRSLINSIGFHEIDPRDGESVTTCVGGKACSFVSYKDGMASCGIEQAFNDHKTEFMKPISCHLYPIRLSKVGKFTALNYHKWQICSPACALGKQEKTAVYKFLRIPLIRAFGEEWYNELCLIAEEYNRLEN